jgi:hypothetical protein
MFWSDWGRVPKIERAGLDGTHRETLLTEGVSWPNGLTIDLVLDRLYWVDAKLSTVGSANLDGSHARTILYSPTHLKHPFSISVFEDLMFWTEWNTHSIYQANKFTGANISAVTRTPLSGVPMVVQVVHPYRQPAYPNHCLPYNGHCTHLCLPAPQVSPHSPRTRCACPAHLLLRQDGRSCTDIPPPPVSIPDSVDAIDAEALPVPSSISTLVVGVVVGSVLAAVLVTAMVILLLQKRLTAKKMITVKFNNPSFHPSQPSTEPVCIQRQTAPGSTVDLTLPAQEMVR